jgi:flagellar basal-body rod protein FlgC
MLDPLAAAIKVAGAGLEVQSARLRVVAENMANANVNGPSPGSDPYARKTITFESELDEAAGANLVRVVSIGTDKQPFRVEYDPGNPAADASGFVKLPNVNIITEMADFREATNSYEANLQIIKQSNNLNSMTLELLRNAS